MSNTVVLLTSDTIGVGDRALGEVLVKSFLFKLAEHEDHPDKIILYNSGVNLIKKSSTLAEDFQTLLEKGTEIKACGTCLNFYNIKPEEIIGEQTNMEYIVESLMTAGKVIKP